MNRRLLSFAVALLLVVPALLAQQKDRSKIADQYKWDLTQLYASDDAWRAEKTKLEGEIDGLGKFSGTLGGSAAQLLAAMDELNRVNKEITRLYIYASMSSDQDTREAKYQAMRQEMNQLGAKLSAVTAYVEPEILTIDKAKIDAFLKQEPKLAAYDHYLDDIVRRKAHTLSPAEEKIIADASVIAGSAGSVYGIFSDADFPYPTVTLSNGETVKLDKPAYSRYRASTNRADREKAMSTFFSALGSYRRTFGTTFDANAQSDIFTMKVRKYDSTLAASLDGPNVPVAVYKSLLDGVNESLPTFHRYLELRKRILGVDQLHYYDLYAPLIASADIDYTAEKAQSTIIAAMSPLGAEYQSVLKKAFAERWIDLYPTEGKRAGAYSNGGGYDVHPYMLINYNGKYDDVGTLAHELGHTMQSYYSNKTQPFSKAGYPTFVAEVASTFNEALLLDYMLKNIKDDSTRLSMLGEYLENARTTLFRQTQFAEFELRAHEMAEKGVPITGDAMDKLYLDITRKYYGHDKGVCIVDDYVKSEWSYIPHFYRSFYVFQYATSFTASQALSSKVLSGDKTATKRYLEFISAGGSKYPVELLKDAGVDMTTTEPLELTVKKMNSVMDQMEAILAKQKK